VFSAPCEMHLWIECRLVFVFKWSNIHVRLPLLGCRDSATQILLTYVLQNKQLTMGYKKQSVFQCWNAGTIHCRHGCII
jgi:hypothetical protein